MRLRCCCFALLLFAGYQLLFSETFSPDRILSEPPPRRVQIASQPTLSAFAEGHLTLEIVVSPDAVPVLRFAAAELGYYLKTALGVEIPVVAEPDPDLTSLVLGDTLWSRASGISVEEMPLDGFFIKSRGTSIYLCGIDDPEVDPVKSGRDNLNYAHGTVTAVYDFLERFLAIRFYFPGEQGAIVPRLSNLAFPEMDIFDRPDLPRRSFAWPADLQFPEANIQPGDLTRFQLQLRNSAFQVPDQSGMESLDIARRWAGQHPEILGADESGQRQKPSEQPNAKRLCLASEFLHQALYLDVEAFLTGKTASARGLDAWDAAAFHPGFFNLSLPENAQNCYCSQCQRYYQSHPESERFWTLISEIALQLQQKGVPGYLTFCSNGLYAQLPQIALPGNVLIAVATENPWFQNGNRPVRLEEQLAFWKKTLKRKPWLAIHLSSALQPSFLPAITPAAIGNFICRSSPAISGAHFRTQYTSGTALSLNYYIAAKCSWNTSLKAEQLLQEHHRLMFGPGAPAMSQFFASSEKLWLALLKAESALPPGQKSRENLWRVIYSPVQIEQFRTCFAEAETATENSPEYRSKVAYFRKAFLAPLEAAFSLLK